MPIAYKLSYDKSISDELRRRFQADIAFLEHEGFRQFSLHQEIVWPFSVIFFFPVYLMMRSGNELIKIERPFRITTFHLLFTCEAHATYAYVYGLGCKYYTAFLDGAWLVSNTSLKTGDQKIMLLKRDADFITARQAWDRHRETLIKLQEAGKHLNHILTFERWTKLEARFDQDNLSSVIGMGVFWVILLSAALYWLSGIVTKIAGAG
jgi:hypothetical protein